MGWRWATLSRVLVCRVGEKTVPGNVGRTRVRLFFLEQCGVKGWGEHSQWGVDEMITLWNRVEVGSGVHGGKGEHTHRQRGEGGSMTFLEQCGTLKLVQGGGRPEHSPMRWGEDPSITILEQCCAGKLVQGLRRADHRLQHNYSGATCMVGGGQITVPGSGERNPA